MYEDVMAAADTRKPESECLDELHKVRKPDVVRSAQDASQESALIQGSSRSEWVAHSGKTGRLSTALAIIMGLRTGNGNLA